MAMTDLSLREDSTLSDCTIGEDQDSERRAVAACRGADLKQGMSQLLEIGKITGITHADPQDLSRYSSARKTYTFIIRHSTLQDYDWKHGSSGINGRFPETSHISVLPRRFCPDRWGTRRGIGGCVPVSSEEVQKLKGWSTLNAAADDEWGKGSRNIVTNPQDYLWAPENGCTESVSVVSVDRSNLSSNVLNVTDVTEWNHATGKGTVSLASGLDQTTSYTVTQESSIGVGASITATVGIPDVESVSATLSTQVTFTNSQSFGTETTDSKSVISSHEVDGSSGETCTVITKSKNHPDEGWHYKWALNIENTLQNVDDHSETMMAQTSTVGSTNTKTLVVLARRTCYVPM
ncbi:hypothetical protein C8J57DRAFT_1252658 [Mycena rebaudengoi]|nr:hypothetical protein C8J57DRAFT_1252658 [Mycena rebaudengoi]